MFPVLPFYFPQNNLYHEKFVDISEHRCSSQNHSEGIVSNRANANAEVNVLNKSKMFVSLCSFTYINVGRLKGN